MDTVEVSSIVITATSAVSAVGPDAKQTCAAIRAGITPFVEHAYITCTPDDPDWDEDLPTYVASVPFINPFLNTVERFTKIAIPALTEIFSNSKLKRTALAKTGLLLALPIIDDSVKTLALTDKWLFDLLRQTGLGGIAKAKISRGGHVGSFALINEAIELLQSGELDQCIVGGVDSYLLEERINHFDKQWRIKSSRNVDGFIPGEGAAMVLLEKDTNAHSRGVKALACLAKGGVGNEQNSFHSQLASTGQGLGESIKATLAGSPSSKEISSIYCDFNGESYFAQEWGLIQSRFADIFNQLKAFNHPAECYGDVGATSGALLIVNAVEDMRSLKEQPENALLATVNDSGLHHTLLLTNYTSI